MKKIALFLSIAALVFSSCKKDEEPSMAPDLGYATCTPKNVVQYGDSVTIAFTYKDPDGDLGENDTENTNLFITDVRNDVTYEFRISQLAPDDAEITIEGYLKAHLKNIALLDENNSTEDVLFTIYTQDRAGNYSDTLLTNYITVHKDSTTIQ